MNFFKQTWQTIFKSGHEFDQIKFIGRTAYYNIDDTIRLRFDIIETGVQRHYGAITITAFNKTQGVIDTIGIRFDDIWGKKKVNNPSFQDGLVPYIWEYDGKISWYIYEPTKEDYKQLMDAINDYASIYR